MSNFLGSVGKGRSPDIVRNPNSIHTKAQILSDRHDYNASAKKPHFNMFEQDFPQEAHRDISPYRVENFIEMLQNFGISEAIIKKRIISQSPLSHAKKGHEVSSESMNEPSAVIRNVRIS